MDAEGEIVPFILATVGNEAGDLLVRFLDWEAPEARREVHGAEEERVEVALARREAVDCIGGERKRAVEKLEFGVGIAQVNAESDRAILLLDEHNARAPRRVGFANDAARFHLVDVLIDDLLAGRTELGRSMAVRDSSWLEREFNLEEMRVLGVLGIHGEHVSEFSEKVTSTLELLRSKAALRI